jgi:hypothetical protein
MKEHFSGGDRVITRTRRRASVRSFKPRPLKVISVTDLPPLGQADSREVIRPLPEAAPFTQVATAAKIVSTEPRLIALFNF